MKNGVEVPTGVRSRYRVKSEGTKHWLIIDDAMKEDTGTYSIMATGGTSEARVQVDCKDTLFFILFSSCIATYLNCAKEIIFISFLFLFPPFPLSLFHHAFRDSETTEDSARSTGYDDPFGGAT